MARRGCGSTRSSIPIETRDAITQALEAAALNPDVAEFKVGVLANVIATDARIRFRFVTNP